MLLRISDRYWSILNCAAVTGVGKILQYHNTEAINDAYNGDESYLDLELIEGHCRRQAPIADSSAAKQIDWRRYSQGLCQQKGDRSAKVALRKALSVAAAAGTQPQASGFSWSLLCLSLLVVGSVGGSVVCWRRRGRLPAFRFTAIQSSVRRLRSRSSAKVARFGGASKWGFDFDFDPLGCSATVLMVVYNREWE